MSISQSDIGAIVSGLKAAGYPVSRGRNGDFLVTTAICHGGGSPRGLAFGSKGIVCYPHNPCDGATLQNLRKAAGIDNGGNRLRPAPTPAPAHSDVDYIIARFRECPCCGGPISIAARDGYPIIRCDCARPYRDYWGALIDAYGKATFWTEHRLADGSTRRRNRREPGKRVRWDGRTDIDLDRAHCRVWHSAECEDQSSCQVVLIEGGKAAAAVVSAGHCAVAWASSAGKTDYSTIQGRRVILWPDNDEAGEIQMGAAVQALRRIDCDMRLVAVGGLSKKEDAADIEPGAVSELIAAATAVAADYGRRSYAWHGGDDDKWACTPDADVGRMMRMYAPDFLVLQDDHELWSLLTDNGHGVWRDSRQLEHDRLKQSRIQWGIDAQSGAGDELPQVNKWLKRDSCVARKQGLPGAGTVYGLWRDTDNLPAGITTAHNREIDATLRYLGAPNGVIDLSDGRLLTGAEARACLVSKSLPVAYNPEATHPAVDKLFAHLGDTEREWLLSALGFALRGNPSRRAYFLVGEPGGGKSTLLNAVMACLGEYGGNVPDGALSNKSAQEKNGPQPELGCFTRHRILVSSDPIQSISAERYKRVSGADTFTYRDLYSPRFETRQSTATMVLACNPDRLPRLALEDTATAERTFVLRYPSIPHDQRDLTLPDQLKDPDAMAALAAVLIRHAVDNPTPPADIPGLAEARAAMRREVLGDAGEWLESAIVADKRGRLTTKELWDAALEAAGESPDAKLAWGFDRQKLIKQARLICDMGNAKLISEGGKKVRAWTGFRLATVEELPTLPEAEPAPALPTSPRPAQIAVVVIEDTVVPSESIMVTVTCGVCGEVRDNDSRCKCRGREADDLYYEPELVCDGDTAWEPHKYQPNRPPDAAEPHRRHRLAVAADYDGPHLACPNCLRAYQSQKAYDGSKLQERLNASTLSHCVKTSERHSDTLNGSPQSKG